VPALHVAAAPAGGHCEVVVYTPERTTSRGALALGHIELLLEVPRSLVASGFNQRRRECEEACRLLGVQSLRDVRRIEQVEALPEPWRQRARHVVQENARVLLAVASADAETLGALMNASHASLRDEYDVSTPELDQLVSLLQEHPAVFGAS
jgi:galactokinase